MKVIIAGCRDYHDPVGVHEAMVQCGFEPTEIVSGGAGGVDRLGQEWATAHHIPFVVFAADWTHHGRSAGPIRNREMAAYAQALVAVWDGLSRGTMNMISEARARGLPVYIYPIRREGTR